MHGTLASLETRRFVGEGQFHCFVCFNRLLKSAFLFFPAQSNQKSISVFSSNKPDVISPFSYFFRGEKKFFISYFRSLLPVFRRQYGYPQNCAMMRPQIMFSQQSPTSKHMECFMMMNNTVGSNSGQSRQIITARSLPPARIRKALLRATQEVDPCKGGDTAHGAASAWAAGRRSCRTDRPTACFLPKAGAPFGTPGCASRSGGAACGKAGTGGGLT